MAQNQSQIDAMRSKLITIATSAGSNAILANLLGKRADDVKDAIAKIDDFKPTDPTLITEEDALTTYCKLNPGVEKCLTQDLSRTFDTLNDNIITFGEGGTGTNYGNSNGIMPGAVSDSSSDPASRKSVAPVGSIIASAAKDNSIEGSSPQQFPTEKVQQVDLLVAVLVAVVAAVVEVQLRQLLLKVELQLPYKGKLLRMLVERDLSRLLVD